jgi:hypothetical protein
MLEAYVHPDAPQVPLAAYTRRELPLTHTGAGGVLQAQTHAPPWQVFPAPQPTQAAPWVPHAVLDSVERGTQVSP